MQYKSHQFAGESNNSFAVKIENLVREIIIQNEIPYYRIESGVEHLTNTGAEENLPVIRVITYFEDTVNKISHILHEEFNVDIDRSTDKKQIRIETFAYKNINYTATLTKARQNQTEYRRSGDKKFEIQICSMLQDAWTGIEKELGYDSNFVPDEAKRDFYRVGALLEMADIEFLKIRTALSQKRVSNNVTPTPQPAPAQAEMPKEFVVDDNANSFIEHLQAVAKEVQKEAAAPQMQQHEALVIREQAVAEVVPSQPVAKEPVYTPAPIIQEPVYAPPPIAQQPVYTPPPVQEPVAIIPPVVEQPVHIPAVATQAANIPVVQPIAPQRVAPVASATGIAPKPTVIPKDPVQNAIIANSDMSVDNLKELAQSINSVENKVNTAPIKQEPAAPKEQPAIIIPPVVANIPTPAPEVKAPVFENIIAAAPQPPVMPAAENEINSSIAQKVSEIVKENGTEKTVPFYNESKPIKAAQFDENIQMTDVSLREFVMSSKLVKEVDQKIAERAGAKINSDVDIEGDVERLRFLKVYSLKQLHDRITDNKDDIVAFAEKWIGKDNGGSFDSGICLFYLEYLLVGKRNDPAFAVEYVVKFISDNDYSARYIIPTYNSIHNTEAPNFSHLTLRA